MRTSKAWLLLAVPAFIGYGLLLFAPIHEQCHIFAVWLTGGRVTSVEWARTWYTGGNNNVIAFAGYYGETWVYTVLILVSRRFDGLWAGAWIGAAIGAYWSSDYAHMTDLGLAIHTLTIVAMAIANGAVLWGHHWKTKAPISRGLVHDDRSISRAPSA